MIRRFRLWRYRRLRRKLGIVSPVEITFASVPAEVVIGDWNAGAGAMPRLRAVESPDEIPEIETGPA